MNTHILLLALIAMLTVAAPLSAAVQTKAVEYKDGDVVLEGFLTYDDAVKGKAPGVLVVHEWWGVNDYAKGRAKQLAEMGYMALAVDMYGKGVLAKTSKDAGELAGKLKGDRPMMRKRVTAGLDVLKANEKVDPKRIAAIGYCFGGTTVLELARSGADIAGVVSFHGGLDSTSPADAKTLKARVLVLTGADDPSVPPAQVNAFAEEMRKAGADWYMTSYGGAVHAFTNPASGNDPSRGAAYNAAADRRSWQAMKDFFAQIFAAPAEKK